MSPHGTADDLDAAVTSEKRPAGGLSPLGWAMSAVIVACVILVGYLWWSAPSLTLMNQAHDREVTCPALGAPLGTGGAVNDYRIGDAG